MNFKSNLQQQLENTETFLRPLEEYLNPSDWQKLQDKVLTAIVQGKRYKAKFGWNDIEGLTLEKFTTRIQG